VEYSLARAGSFQPDICRADHLGPFLCVLGNELAEVGIGVPLPVEAKLILLGFTLAKAMNSSTVLAGIDGWTTTTPGVRVMLATGAMSRTKLKLSLS
jgi:hypothetical protein